jgi:hypothetical protein
LPSALILWEKAAQDGHVYAHIELAKHFEHRQRDPAAAMRWALSGRDLVLKDETLPVYMRKHWLEEIAHRLSRLEKKVHS